MVDQNQSDDSSDIFDELKDVAERNRVESEARAERHRQQKLRDDEYAALWNDFFNVVSVFNPGDTPVEVFLEVRVTLFRSLAQAIADLGWTHHLAGIAQTQRQHYYEAPPDDRKSSGGIKLLQRCAIAELILLSGNATSNDSEIVQKWRQMTTAANTGWGLRDAADDVYCFISHRVIDESREQKTAEQLSAGKNNLFTDDATAPKPPGIPRGLSYGDQSVDDESNAPQYSENVNVKPVTGKLKIMFLAANPETTTGLKFDEEFRSIQNRISTFYERIDLRLRPALRHGDLQLALLEEKPHIVHFSGHGNSSDELILQDDQGRPHNVSGRALIDLFKTLKDDIRLVVFNTCFSKSQAERTIENIAFAIGMNQAIGDAAAMQFAASLYQAIGFGRTIQEAFELGTNALQLAGIAEDLTPQLFAHPQADATKTRLIEVDGHDVEAASVDHAPTGDSSTALPRDQLAEDLGRSLTNGSLRDSRLAVLVQKCWRSIGPLKLSDDYDFPSLEMAIQEADLLVLEADRLAGKLEGREFAIQSVRLVVVELARAVNPSRRLQLLVIDVTEQVLKLPEIAITICWPNGGKDEFYNALAWGQGIDIDNMLGGFCDD